MLCTGYSIPHINKHTQCTEVAHTGKNPKKDKKEECHGSKELLLEHRERGEGGGGAARSQDRINKVGYSSSHASANRPENLWAYLIKIKSPH